LGGSPAPLYADPYLLNVSPGTVAAGGGATATVTLWMPAGTYTFTATDRGTVVYGPTAIVVAAGSSTTIGAASSGVTGLSVGSGAPSGGSVGNFYLRTDTPTVANQRLYVAVPAAGTTPAFRSIVTSAPNPSGLVKTITIPASVVVGDLMLLSAGNNITTSVTASAGWTLLTSDTVLDPNESGLVGNAIFYKVAVAGDTGGAATVTITYNTNNASVVSLAAYSGTSGGAPQAFAVGKNAVVSATLTAPAVTALTGGVLIVKYFFGYNNAAQFTTPFTAGPATSRANTKDTAGTQALYVSDLAQAASGASAVETATTNALCSSVVHAVVLAGVAGVGTSWAGIA